MSKLSNELPIRYSGLSLVKMDNWLRDININLWQLRMLSASLMEDRHKTALYSSYIHNIYATPTNGWYLFMLAIRDDLTQRWTQTTLTARPHDRVWSVSATQSSYRLMTNNCIIVLGDQ